MAEFDFPRTPGGTIADLWSAILRLLPQLGGKVTIARDVSVGTTETPVAHGLPFAPLEAIPLPRSDVRAWQTRDPDSKYVYVAASASATMNVAVLR